MVYSWVKSSNLAKQVLKTKIFKEFVNKYNLSARKITEGHPKNIHT